MVSSTRNPEPPAILRLASALLWIRRRKTTAFIMRARLEWVRKRAVLAKTVSQSALMRLLEVAMAKMRTDSSIALGAYSSVTRKNAVALGFQSQADRANAVSVGS